MLWDFFVLKSARLQIFVKIMARSQEKKFGSLMERIGRIIPEGIWQIGDQVVIRRHFDSRVPGSIHGEMRERHIVMFSNGGNNPEVCWWGEGHPKLCVLNGPDGGLGVPINCRDVSKAAQVLGLIRRNKGEVKPYKS
jgi:hypothetical protein